jgi:hypothetical protein
MAGSYKTGLVTEQEVLELYFKLSEPAKKVQIIWVSKSSLSAPAEKPGFNVSLRSKRTKCRTGILLVSKQIPTSVSTGNKEDMKRCR